MVKEGNRKPKKGDEKPREKQTPAEKKPKSRPRKKAKQTPAATSSLLAASSSSDLHISETTSSGEPLSSIRQRYILRASCVKLKQLKKKQRNIRKRELKITQTKSQAIKKARKAPKKTVKKKAKQEAKEVVDALRRRFKNKPKKPLRRNVRRPIGVPSSPSESVSTDPPYMPKTPSSDEQKTSKRVKIAKIATKKRQREVKEERPCISPPIEITSGERSSPELVVEPQAEPLQLNPSVLFPIDDMPSTSRQSTLIRAGIIPPEFLESAEIAVTLEQLRVLEDIEKFRSSIEISDDSA